MANGQVDLYSIFVDLTEQSAYPGCSCKKNLGAVGNAITNATNSTDNNVFFKVGKTNSQTIAGSVQMEDRNDLD